MGYVIVVAEFTDTTKQMRNNIYRELEELHWRRIPELESKTFSTWYCGFWDYVKKDEAIQTSMEQFNRCSTLYCNAKLVLHYGEDEPVFAGLKLKRSTA